MIEVKFCTAKWTHVPVGPAKFDVNRCSESPLQICLLLDLNNFLNPSKCVKLNCSDIILSISAASVSNSA